MRVSIHQPSYFPWLGLLAKIAKSELYIALDHVAANRESYQYRNIFWCNGEAKYLTLPVNYHVDKPICELQFRTPSWSADHLNKLQNYYRRAPYFEEVYATIEPLYRTSYGSTSEFIIATMRFAFNAFGIQVQLVRSSALNVEGKRGELVLNLCRAVGASTYVSGMGASEYMQPMLPAFAEAKIGVEWHTYMHPIYPQHPAHAFVSGLASLDILFHAGFASAREIFQTSLTESS